MSNAGRPSERNRFDSEKAREAGRKSADARRRKKAEAGTTDKATEEPADALATLQAIFSDPKASTNARVLAASKVLAQAVSSSGASGVPEVLDLESITFEQLEGLTDEGIEVLRYQCLKMAQECVEKAGPLTAEQRAELDAWAEERGMRKMPPPLSEKSS
jgi:broad specificity phosphatase PhoE